MALQEGFLHIGVAGDLRKKPELDLGIVCIQQDVLFVGRYEITAHLPSQLAPYGDVLHIGIGGGNAARGRSGLVEAGVESSVFIRQGNQILSVGAAQLDQLTVVQNASDDGVQRPQLGKRFRIRGIACSRFFTAGKAELFKKNFTQLLGRVQIEQGARHRIDLRCQFRRGTLQGADIAVQSVRIQAEAVFLHIRKHLGERNFHIRQQLGHAVLRYRIPQNGHQTGYRVRFRGQIGLADIHHAVPQCGLVKRIRSLTGGEKIGRQHRIEYAVYCNVPCSQSLV